MKVTELNKHYSDKDKWPTFLSADETEISSDANVFRTVCDIPSSLSWFSGHFPDQAVLPGVVQVNWANSLAIKLFNTEEFRGVNSLKFNTMILPENKITLTLTYNSEKQTVTFSYKSDDTLFSSGVLVFSAVSH